MKAHEAWLVLGEDCNMKCSYCYIRPQRKEAQMTDEEIHKSIDLLIEGGKERGRIEVMLFGGEPTLYPDRVEEAIRYTMTVCHEHQIVPEIIMYTNGTIMNGEIYRIFSTYSRLVDLKVCIGLDGVGEVHDIHRRFNNGFGTYDTIAKNLEIWKEIYKGKPDGYFPYTNVNPSTVDRMYETFTSLRKLGFERTHFIRSRTWKDIWTDEALQEYENQLLSIVADIFIECRDTKSIDPLLRCHPLRNYYLNTGGGVCDAGSGTFCVVPGGDMYPCFAFYGSVGEAAKIGNVFGGRNEDLMNKFLNATKKPNQKCEECSSDGCDRCLMLNYIHNRDVEEQTYTNVICAASKIEIRIVGVLKEALRRQGIC